MTNAPIRIVVLLAALSFISIIITQVYLVNKAVDSQQQQFDHTVQIALRNVVESVCEVTGVDVPSNDPIDQVSNNYFVVRTNNKIDLEALEYHLKAELTKREVNLDFEYGVYDCQTDRMVYGDLVSLSTMDRKDVSGTLPKLSDYDYYFGVYFPDKRSDILWGMDWWKFTSAITILVLIFFSYTLFVLLRQKRLSAIQRDFVNNITHEFKTPIATLKVASEVLGSTSEASRSLKYAQIVKKECQRLEKHVDQLLKSAIAEERQNLLIESVDLSQLTHQIIAGYIHEKEVSLEIEQGVIVEADKYFLENAIFNLFDNAVKYGGSTIEIRVVKDIDSGQGYCQIWDNGSSINKKESANIFKKFYRISTGDAHDVKGFGLGLFVVKKSIKQMSGTVNVDISNGSAFTINLKLA